MRAALALAALVAALFASAPPGATAAQSSRQPDLDARAWALIEARSGRLLAAHNAGRRLPVASATKLMTAHVALRSLPPGRIVTMAPYPALSVESLLGVPAGEPVSVRDLLYGLILRSGNDAAHTLAVRSAGSLPRFVRRMNRSAAALGLSDSRFANPVGLDEPGSYSSAYDLTALARRLLRVPLFRRIADSRRAVLRSQRPPREIETVNDLLLAEPWATGVKTGRTVGADYVLVGSARRKGLELISAVLGAPSEAARDAGTVKLLEYGFVRVRRLRQARRAALLRRAAARRRAREEKSAVDRVRSFVAGNPIPLGVAACVILVGVLLPWRRARRPRQGSDARGASREERRMVREQSRRERNGEADR